MHCLVLDGDPLRGPPSRAGERTKVRISKLRGAVALTLTLAGVAAGRRRWVVHARRGRRDRCRGRPCHHGDAPWRPERLPYNTVPSKEIDMAESTITSKGQTTVPADIRALVNAKPGTRLVWSVMPDGTIIVRVKSKSVLDMAGMLKAPKGKRVSIEGMSPWR
jgi:antitoxin PrlF